MTQFNASEVNRDCSPRRSRHALPAAMMAGFLLVLVAVPALAQVARMASFTRATERVDNTPLPLSEIAYEPLECFVNGDYETPVVSVRSTPPSTRIITPPVFLPGVEYICRIATMDTDGRSSEWNYSNVFTGGIKCEPGNRDPDCDPRAPSSIVIQLVFEIEIDNRGD